MVARSSFKALDQANFYNQKQSWYMKQHFSYKGRKLRMVICRNAYEEQSFAVIQVQHQETLAWIEIGSIPKTQMHAKACYSVTDPTRGYDMVSFIRDRQKLEEIARMII